MSVVYATVDEYRADTGDLDSSNVQVEGTLEAQSVKLRAETGITDNRKLTSDQKVLCKALVIDASRKKLVAPQLPGLGNVTGATQASFLANGFQGSYTMPNTGGSAYWDRSMLTALKRSLGKLDTIAYVPMFGESE